MEACLIHCHVLQLRLCVWGGGQRREKQRGRKDRKMGSTTASFGDPEASLTARNVSHRHGRKVHAY